MNVLAIETSSAAGTIALAVDGELTEREIPTPREQTELALPLIAELLDARGLRLDSLSAVAFGRGPGSFTGLRVAAALAQGLSLAARVPIVAVSSLAALAQRAWESEAISRALICVDARMHEVYSAAYTICDGLAQLEHAERVCAPAAVACPEGAWSGIGSGFSVYARELERLSAAAERIVADLAPRARDLLPLAVRDVEAGRFVAPEHALPVYLREQSAWRR